MEIDGHRTDKLSLEEHGQAQGGTPAILLGQGIEWKAAVELNVLGEDGPLLDDDLGD